MIMLKNNQNDETEKKKVNKLKEWCKEHKTELLIAGLSIGSIIVGVILNNNSEINKFTKWFNSASVEELKSARDAIQADYRNSALDNDYRARLYDILHLFDCKIREKDGVVENIGFPVKSENGWYLQGD